MKRFLMGVLTMLLIGCSNTKVEEKDITVDEIYSESTDYLANYNYEIDLEDAITIARDRNLQIKSKELEVQIATLDRKIAFGNFLPSVNLGMSYMRVNDPVELETGIDRGPIHIPNLRIVDKESHTFGVNAQLPVFVPALWYLYDARKKGEDISKMVLDLTDKEIQLEVMGSYYMILYLEDRVNSLRADLFSAEKLYEKGKVSYEIEEITSWQLKKLEVNLKVKKLTLDENRRSLDIAKMEFLKVLNLNPLTKYSVKRQEGQGNLNLTLEEAIYRALNNNKMIKINDKLGEIDEDKVKIAISNFLPKVILDGGYVNTSHAVLTDPDFLFGSVSGVVSIFNGFKNVNEYKKAKKQKEISDLKLEEEFLKTILETAKAYKRMETIGDVYKITNLDLQAEKERVDQSSWEYKLGVIDEIIYLKNISNYEASKARVQETGYLSELNTGVLKMVMGENPTKYIAEKEEIDEAK